VGSFGVWLLSRLLGLRPPEVLAPIAGPWVRCRGQGGPCRLALSWFLGRSSLGLWTFADVWGVVSGIARLRLPASGPVPCVRPSRLSACSWCSTTTRWSRRACGLDCPWDAARVARRPRGLSGDGSPAPPLLVPTGLSGRSMGSLTVAPADVGVRHWMLLIPGAGTASANANRPPS